MIMRIVIQDFTIEIHCSYQRVHFSLQLRISLQDVIISIVALIKNEE